MKTNQKLCAFFALLLSVHLQAQPGLETTIEGRILDQKTAGPIAYANIYNKRTQKGTISNLDGYFRLLVERGSDTLVVNQELKLNDQQNQNEQFFNSPGTMTNQTAFSKNAYTPNGILEHPYVFWTRNRLSFTGRYALENASGNTVRKAALEKPFHLGIKLFLDANLLAGKMHTTTATGFDPLVSYYRLPVTDTVLCFVNLYFDLMELERRALEEEIRQSDQSIQTIERLYEARLVNIEDLSRQFFKEVEQGKKKKELKKWNELVKDKLGIDNIEFFKLYQQNGK